MDAGASQTGDTKVGRTGLQSQADPRQDKGIPGGTSWQVAEGRKGH